jgi:hypothetical protein
MNQENQPAKSGITKWTKDHWIGVLGIVLGALIAVSVPIWQTYWVESPSLSIEINSVTREISPTAGIILDDHPELKLLPDLPVSSGFYAFPLGTLLGERSSHQKEVRLSPDELRVLLSDLKDELSTLPEKIETQRKDVADVERLTPATLTTREVSKLNRPLPDEVDVETDVFQEKRKSLEANRDYFVGIINEFKSKYSEILQDTETRYAEVQANLPLIERKTETLIKQLDENNSYFKLSTVLLNSGRASTSIKKPALLRIYIGTGNYVDLKLKLQDYANASEVAAHSSRIATFESDEISSLPDEDQKLINAYWGQSVQALLFTEDITGAIVESNPIVFSEGLYERIIYDRLKSAASRASTLEEK